MQWIHLNTGAQQPRSASWTRPTVNPPAKNCDALRRPRAVTRQITGTKLVEDGVLMGAHIRVRPQIECVHVAAAPVRNPKAVALGHMLRTRHGRNHGNLLFLGARRNSARPPCCPVQTCETIAVDQTPIDKPSHYRLTDQHADEDQRKADRLPRGQGVSGGE
jgi:hypothetical protein